MSHQYSTDAEHDSDQGNKKDQQKQIQSQVRMTKKRQRNDKILPFIDILTFCNPEKYFLYDTASNTVSSMYLRYIQNLQQNDCVAWLENWARILHHASYPKRFKEAGIKQTTLQHPWNNFYSIHYIPVDTAASRSSSTMIFLYLFLFYLVVSLIWK